jgi:hypothetical protein
MSSIFNDVMDALYSPLGKKWCMFYYILAVIMFISFTIVFIGAFSKLVSNTGSSSLRVFLTGVVGVLLIGMPLFLGYIQARIMYSVCDAALK